MTEINDIYEFLTSYAPLELQESYDNAGFLCGSKKGSVSAVLLALDVTSDVINEAARRGCTLIISHHPLIFGTISSVTDETSTGRKLISLIKNGISVISMHTNLDKVLVNDVLIEALGAVNHDTLSEFIKCGCIDKPLLMADYIPFCKKALNNSSFRYYDSGRPVYKIACTGGAGDSGLYEVFSAGCDTFITADVHHHIWLEAKELGINLIDGDHFNTEGLVIPVLAGMLKKEFPGCDFMKAGSDTQVVQYA